MTKCILLLLFFLNCGVVVAQQPNPSPDFPSNGDILAIVDQASRAMDLYEMATKTAEDGAGTKLDKDRELIAQTRELLAKVKNDTHNFNALTSIVILMNLDDAARNVALDAVQFTGLTATKAMDGNLDAAKLTLANAQFFSSTGEAVAEASTAWGNQVVRYSVAQAQLNSMAATALNRCTAALKGAAKRQ